MIDPPDQTDQEKRSRAWARIHLPYESQAMMEVHAGICKGCGRCEGVENTIVHCMGVGRVSLLVREGCILRKW